MFQEIQAVFTEELVPTTAQWPLGTVGVIDESGFEKAGTESVGVARQWCGRLGKTENCQVGVFLIGVTPGGVAALEAQLLLTEEAEEARVVPIPRGPLGGGGRRGTAGGGVATVEAARGEQRAAGV